MNLRKEEERRLVELLKKYDVLNDEKQKALENLFSIYEEEKSLHESMRSTWNFGYDGRTNVRGKAYNDAWDKYEKDCEEACMLWQKYNKHGVFGDEFWDLDLEREIGKLDRSQEFCKEMEQFKTFEHHIAYTGTWHIRNKYESI